MLAMADTSSVNSWQEGGLRMHRSRSAMVVVFAIGVFGAPGLALAGSAVTEPGTQQALSAPFLPLTSFDDEGASDLTISRFFSSESSLQRLSTTVGGLQCGPSDININTSCVATNARQSFCFSQTVSFIDRQKSTARTLTYMHSQNNPFAATLLTDASCEGDAKKRLVVLHAYNGGNCDRCEWIDVFLPDGTYVGSTDNLRSDLPLKSHPLPQPISDELSDKARNQVSAMLDIQANIP